MAGRTDRTSLFLALGRLTQAQCESIATELRMPRERWPPAGAYGSIRFAGGSLAPDAPVAEGEAPARNLPVSLTLPPYDPRRDPREGLVARAAAAIEGVRVAPDGTVGLSGPVGRDSAVRPDLDDGAHVGATWAFVPCW